MAVELQSSETITLLKRHLDKKLRYRCILIQCKNIRLLSQFSNQVKDSFDVFGAAFHKIDALSQFDSIGAFSCDKVIGEIKAISVKQPVLISGPLHFLDYWLTAHQTIFWRYLATFSSGIGIVVTDVFRKDNGPFQTVRGFSRKDFRCLKSSLECTQDRLA